MLFFSVLFLLLAQVRGHGRLTKPISRHAQEQAARPDLQNKPVDGGALSNDFVCRGTPKAKQADLQAGGSLTLRWLFTAAHVGDCAVYISYDNTASGDDRKNMKFFKIANLFDCKSQNDQDVTIQLPDWLPEGNAVLRWDWYALHNPPNVEFYAQCVDVYITGTSNEVAKSDINMYSIIGGPADATVFQYPINANTGVGYRNAFNSPENTQKMTGPPCARGYTGNQCARTASGTSRFIDIGPLGVGGGGGGGGTNTPSPTANVDDVPSQCEVYEVKSGDSLSSIATSYTNQGKTVTWKEICDANGISNCDVLEVGDDLIIPCGSCGCTVGGAKNQGSGGGSTGGGGGGANVGLIVFLVILFMLAGAVGAAYFGCLGVKAYEMTHCGNTTNEAKAPPPPGRKAPPPPPKRDDPTIEV